MARWITVRRPFDYRWPDVAALTAFKEPGDYQVKDEIADFAVENGYAVEGKTDAGSRSNKGGPKRRRRRKGAAAAKTADTGPAADVGGEDAANADRTADRSTVDSDAG